MMEWTKKEILDVLRMPEERFYAEILPEAGKQMENTFGHTLKVSALMGYTNICKNQCLYCGMRAANSALKRFRVPPCDVVSMCTNAAMAGYKRVFLVAGEDPKYAFGDLLDIVRLLKEQGMEVMLAGGEFESTMLKELAAAGVDLYTLKFEMSDPEHFNTMNPSTSFDRRMRTIEAVRKTGMRLGSGNIIDWPGQTDDELANDILLMRELEISWAPVIPYMPAAGTPLAVGAKPGSLLRLYKEISILRLMMPGIDITAQQPGADLRKGLSDPEANCAAVKAGANILFFDLLPDAQAQNFRVVDDRNITGSAHIAKIAEMGGYTLDRG